MCANLKQLGFPVQFVYGNLDWQLAENQLLGGIWTSFATRYLKKAKVGLIGYQAPGFQDFHPAHPALMRQTFGPILLHLGLTFDYVETSKTLDQSEVDKDVREVTDTYKVFAEKDLVDKNCLVSSSRHFLTMKALIRQHNLDSLAVRCWPELPGPPSAGGMDQWCYMALARLASEGFPISCEGDVDGALGCMIAKFLGCGTIYLSDWLEHDQTTLTLWHGGMAPVQLSQPMGEVGGPTINRHFNNKKPGCLEASIKIGMEVTVFRLWVYENRYHLLSLEGRTVKPKRHLLGNNGLVQFGPNTDLVKGFNDWLQIGFPHHVCVVEGHRGSRIEAFCKQQGVKIIK